MKKKLLAMLLAGCMVLSMTACGEKETETPAETTENNGQEETAQIDTSALGTSKLTELGEYQGITYKPMDVTVTDEEIEAQNYLSRVVFISFIFENLRRLREIRPEQPVQYLRWKWFWNLR